MIQNLRQIRSRIRGIENVRKITRAMQMVSSAKLNQIKKKFYSANSYFLSLEAVLKDLLADSEKGVHPLLKKREEIRNVALCVMASDTGLCGTYNHNLLGLAEDFLGSYDKDKVRLIAVGREAFSHFTKKDFPVEKSYMGLYGRYVPKLADEIAKDLMDIFSSGEADEVYLAYTRFRSSLRHEPAIEKFLEVGPAGGRDRHCILEPGATAILEEMVPRYLFTKMRVAMLDAFTSEHSARMFAMKTATDNADDMIETLTLARNKARQAAITKEVVEIAMAAEAMRG